MLRGCRGTVKVLQFVILSLRTSRPIIIPTATIIATLDGGTEWMEMWN